MDIFGDLEKKLMDMIGDWIHSVLSAVFKFLAEVLFNHKEMAGLFEEIYGIFVVFGGVLLVAIILFRIISGMLSEGAETGEVRVSELLIASFKASIMVFLLPFLLYLVVNKIVYPLGAYFFQVIADGSSKGIKQMLSSAIVSPVFGAASSIPSLLLLCFLVVVLIVFTFKMCVYHADLLLLEILSVGAAISIATEKYDFSEVWWREFLSQVISIIAQTLMMAGIVHLITNFDSWYDFMLIIGLGVLIIRGPSVLRSMWYGTGGGRAAMNTTKAASRIAMLKLIKR